MHLAAVPLSVVLVAAVPLGGCMMAMRGGHHSTAPRQTPPDGAILATGRTGETSVAMALTAAAQGAASTVTLHVTEGANRAPVDGARLTVRVQPLVSSHGPPHHGAAGTPTPVELPAVAVPDRPGVYEARHAFASPGLHEIQVTLHASKPGGADVLFITSTYDAGGTAEHDSRRWTPMAIVGGLAMAGLMALRLLVF